MPYIIIIALILASGIFGFVKVKSMIASIITFLKDNFLSFVIAAIIFIAVIVLVVNLFIALLPYVIIIGLIIMVVSALKSK